MKRGTNIERSRLLVLGILTLALAAQGGCNRCARKSSDVNFNPWARALPKTTAAYGLPTKAEARVTVSRSQLLVAGRPLLKLKDGRLETTALRDGVDGLYVPALAKALRPLLKKRTDGSPSPGRLAILCHPAAPYRTLRAVLYTAMRAGFKRPWLVAEGAGGKRVGLPLELPSVPSDQSHGLRPSPTRTPALAVGLDAGGTHVTRWGRTDCPHGIISESSACINLDAIGFLGKSPPSLTRFLRDRYQAQGRRPGRRRPPSNAIMVWAGLDERVAKFVRLLDAVREPPGGASTCKIVPDPKTHRWRRTGSLADPASTSGRGRGCLYYQTVVVWSKPGHRKN